MGFKMVIDSDVVIKRFALKDIEEVHDAVESALTAAHAVLQGLMHTVFEKHERTDIFFLERNRFPEQPMGFACRLSQGFIWDSVVVRGSDQGRKALAASSKLIATEDVTIEPLKGVVYVDQSYADNWVKATYTAGFDTDHKAPDWLREAVLAFIPHLLGEASGGGSDAATMNAVTAAAKMDYTVAAKIVEPYLRNSSLHFLPLVATIVS